MPLIVGVFSPEKLVVDLNVAVSAIRDYSRSQAEVWQTVPFWALEADGRSGYQDSCGQACQNRSWMIESSASNGIYTVYVDLRNGELMLPGFGSVLANSGDIARAFMRDPNDFDASRLVLQLKESAKAPYMPGFDRVKVEKWREEMRRAYGVKQPTN